MFGTLLPAPAVANEITREPFESLIEYALSHNYSFPTSAARLVRYPVR